MPADIDGTMPGGSIEDRLRRLYDVTMPAAVAAALDRRTSAAMAAAPSSRPLLTRPRVLAAIAIAALLATVAAAPLLRFFEGWGERFDRVRELSTPIGQSAIDDGYRVTIVSAYADGTSLRLAVTVEDLEDRGWAEISIISGTVRDTAGRAYPLSEGQFGHPEAGAGESWLFFTVPAGAAAEAVRTMTVDFTRIDVRPDPMPTLANGDPDIDHLWTSVAGSWSFTFDLPVGLTRTARPATTATVGGITATWVELSVGPASAHVTLVIDGLPDVPADWAWDPQIRIEHNGKSLDITRLEPGSVTRDLALEAEPGFADLSGTWVITIDRFERAVPDPSAAVTTEAPSLEGPWVLEFAWPPATGS